MAVGYETKTITTEIETEPQLLVWKHDYEGRKVRGKDDWNETSLFDNGDGSRTVHTNLIPISVSPQGGENTWTDDLGRSNDMLIRETGEYLVRISSTKTGDAMYNIGVFAQLTDGDSEREGDIEMNYLSPEAMNRNLDTIREATGWAPRIVVFEGKEFSALQQTEALERGEILIADDPLTEQHDITAHGSAWLLLPESTLKLIAQRSRAIYDAAQDKTGAPIDVMNAMYRFKEHFGLLETTISFTLPSKIQRGMGNQADIGLLENALEAVMFGYDNHSAEQEAIVNQEANATIARVNQLAELNLA